MQAGGRGKAGGVKLAETPEDAVARAGDILGMDIKGLTVHRVLVAPAADIQDEYYFSFLVDRANRDYPPAPAPSPPPVRPAPRRPPRRPRPS